MQENDNQAPEIERQAEEFAEEMHAEPHGVDGEPGEPAPEEQAGAEAEAHIDETPEAPREVVNADGRSKKPA